MQDVVPHGHACNVQTTTRCLSLRNHCSNEKRNLCILCLNCNSLNIQRKKARK